MRRQTGHFAVSCPSLRHPRLRGACLYCCGDVCGGDAGGTNEAPCFARHMVLFAPRKKLLEKTADELADPALLGVKNLRIDVVARMALGAVFLGHGVRRNAVFDVWAREGVFRVSANGTAKLFPGEAPMVAVLRGLQPMAVAEAGFRCFPREQEGPADAVAASGGAGRCLEEGGAAGGDLQPPDFLIFEENAAVSLEERLAALPREKGADDSYPSEKARLNALRAELETPILVGDHEGIEAADLAILRDAMRGQEGGETEGENEKTKALNVLPVHLGRASLLGSSCVAILHFLTDKLHLCSFPHEKQSGSPAA